MRASRFPLLTLVLALLVGCSGSPADGTSCTVVANADGTTTVSCTDGTSVTIPDGNDGNDGTSCSVTDNGDGTTTISCTDGTTVTIPDGNDGTSCSVTDNGDGTTTVSCTDGTSVTIPHGSDGASCSATDNGDGSITIACTDGTSVSVSNGTSCSVTDNGDGTKTVSCSDGTSVVITDPVSLYAGVVEGSVTIQNSVDAALYAATTEITGDLTITGAGLTSVTLPALVQVGGSLVVQDTNALVSVEFPVLNTVGGSGSVFQLQNNDMLATADLSNVSTFNGTQVIFVDNFALAACAIDDLVALLGSPPDQTISGNNDPCSPNPCTDTDCTTTCGEPTEYVCGAVCDSAVEFPGLTASSVSVAADSNLLAGSFTLEFWVRVDSGSMFVGQYSAGSTNAYYIEISDAVGVSFVAQQDTNTVTVDLSPPLAMVGDGRFHHVAGVYNAGTNTISLYVDGVASGSAASAFGNVPTGELIFGPNDDASPTIPHGAIDAVRLWSSALSAATLSTRVRCETPSGAGGEWRFEEGSGSTAANTSGTAPDGTLTGSATHIATPHSDFDPVAAVFADADDGGSGVTAGTCFAIPTDFADAETICAADGGRLCSTDDLLGIAAGTGCSYDFQPVWSGSTCLEQQGYQTVQVTTLDVQCETDLSTVTGGLRCCYD